MKPIAFANPSAPVLAALDLGTNNCRLLVARPHAQGFDVLDSFSRIVRLGQGLGQDGRLSDAAQERTLAALRVCARIMAKRQVGLARCVATAACRQASNGAAFLDRVRKNTGISFEILGAEEESRLAFLGCLPLIDRAARHVLVIDIGGGSTELFWLERCPIEGPVHRCALSVPIGVVGLAEMFGGGANGATFQAMVDRVETAFRPLEERHGINAGITGQPVQMLGTSGTVTTLAALHMKLTRYDRRRVDGVALAQDAIRDVAERLQRMTHAQRAAHGCIGPGRADLVIAGCAILEAIQRIWPMPSLRVADRGVREGILHLLAGRSLAADLATDAMGA
ncbi:Ppx/GppA phosphatase family protein [Marinivivus vitaminiproducens]|uniref:Ppx/GppA phosphatase family protein n=1 Tax=Marinivivus vitaminiproducens TaxID=3035935 RepID=UPI0027A37805|nr:Ppx/GppA phosphatase family protein [Geminicoccaceae bacterium SCSIO 64248]